MPVSGVVLADTFQTTWINLTNWEFLCVLQITLSVGFLLFCFDCNDGLGEQNEHATSHFFYSHMHIRRET